MYENSKFTWGDVVHISKDAPPSCAPDCDGHVVGLTLINNDVLQKLYGMPLGTMVYTIELSRDATDREVAEVYLEKADWGWD